MSLTLAKLKRFVRERNKSAFASNLQFGIDAETAGIDPKELGDARPFMLDSFKGYEWKPEITEHGKKRQVRLVEFGRGLYLEGFETGLDTAAMFKLMEQAETMPPGYGPALQHPSGAPIAR